MQREGTHDARDIDNAARRRFADQRQQKLCEIYRSKEIRLENLPEQLEPYVAGIVRSGDIGTGGQCLFPDPRVVDEKDRKSVV